MIFLHNNLIICRKCKCFKRDKESEEEDLTISTQFLDDMSTDEESDISLSNDSENDLNEFEVDLFHDDDDYYYL